MSIISVGETGDMLDYRFVSNGANPNLMAEWSLPSVLLGVFHA